MFIVTRCPDCDKKLKIPEKLSGQVITCPACQAQVMVPMPLAEPDTGDDSGLDLNVLEELAQPTPIRPRVDPNLTREGQVKAGAETYLGKLELAGTGSKRTESTQKRPLLSIAGLDVTWWRLAVVLLPIVGVLVWYFTGPGQQVHVLGVQPVQMEVVLEGLAFREPFSLLTGQGDMSVGLKGPQSKSRPSEAIAKKSHVFSLGGSDQLIVTQPHQQGDYLLVELDVRQDVFDGLKQTANYDVVFNANRFALHTPSGQKLDPILIFESLDPSVELDLAGAQTIGHQSLLPAGVEPASQDLKRGSGGAASGTVTYQGSTQGELSFTSFYFSSGGAAGVKGVSAQGKVTRRTDANSVVTYDYQGSAMTVSWDRSSSGWWTTSRYTHDSEPTPWHRHRVTLLFKRPPAGSASGAGDYELTLADTPIAWIDPGANYAPPKPQPTAIASKPSAPQTTPQSPSVQGTASLPASPAPVPPVAAVVRKKPSSSNNPLAYFDVLVEARDKARGIVAMSTMQQFGYAFHLYLQDHQQQWPDALDQLRPYLSGYDQVIVNPRTKANPGYLYVKPKPDANPLKTAILYESRGGYRDLSGSILYADGHVKAP